MAKLRKKHEQWNPDDDSLLVRAGTVGAYLVGALLLVGAGRAAIGGSLVSGAFLLVAGLLSLPVVHATLWSLREVRLGRWTTIALVLVTAALGGVLAEDTEIYATSEDDLIEKDARTLVIQENQLHSDWNMIHFEGDEQSALSGYYIRGDADYHREGTTTLLYSEATVYDSVEEAKREYQSQHAEAREEHSTESIEVGHEGFIWVDGNNAQATFRDSNVVARVTYRQELGFRVKGHTVEFARIMHGNFD